MTKIISPNANIPRAKLIEYHQEFQSMKHTGIGMLLRKRIQEFYDANGERIKAIYELQQKEIKEFYEHDESGKLIQRQIIDNGNPQVDEQGNPRMEAILREGKTELEFNEVMKKQAAEMIPFTMT